MSFEELLLTCGHVVFGKDRLDRAFGLAQRAIDALLGVDHEQIRPFVEAVDRADLDAVGVLTLDAAFEYDKGHLLVPEARSRNRQILLQKPVRFAKAA